MSRHVARPITRRALSVVSLLCLSVGLAAVAGCPEAGSDFDDIEYQGEEALSGNTEHLSRAVRMVENSYDYNANLVPGHVLTQLGQWIHDQPPVDEWSADPMTSTLPKRYQPYARGEALSLMGFLPPDFFVLNEAVWTRNVSRWQVQQHDARRQQLQTEIDRLQLDIERATSRSGSSRSETELEDLRSQLLAGQAELTPPWLAKLKAKHEPQHVDDLMIAMQLFDWTVRNVRPDPTNWEAEMPDQETIKTVGPDNDVEFPAPPGAGMSAYRGMLLGRGDASTRARIFLLLARQQGIDVIMLGLKQGDGQLPRTWVAAALIGDELYLFEPELGLALRGPDGQGPCTLTQLRNDPSLLRQFDLDGQPYHMQPKDLERLIALIDATPGYLAQRMMLVERSLPSEQRLRLTVSPSTLARKLRKQGLSEAAIWADPYRQFEFEQLTLKSPTMAKAYREQELGLASPLPLKGARLLHFRGELDNSDLKQNGARHFYMQCRPSERQIQTESKRLRATVARLQKIPAAEREEVFKSLPPEAKPPYRYAATLLAVSEAEREIHFDTLQEIAHVVKTEATFWLGILAIEQQQAGAAIDYLGVRTLEADPDGAWSEAARYNLARIYENAGQLDKAMEFYRASQSPQRHGDLVRAKRIAQRSSN